MQEAYIIAGLRSAVGKAPKGVFRFTRADDLAADVIRQLVATIPNLNNEDIDDVIVFRKDGTNNDSRLERLFKDFNI